MSAAADRPRAGASPWGLLRSRVRRSRMVRALRHNPLALGALVLIGALTIAAVFAPFLTPYSPSHVDTSAVLVGPSAEHWLGTDSLGYDMYTRLLYGARISLTMAVISVGLAVAVGVPVGAVSGYYRGVLGDHVIMRVADAAQALPALILALAVTAVLGSGMVTAAIAIAASFVPHFVRITRAQVLVARGTQFVEAAKVAGAGDLRILRRHILPSAVGPVIVQATVAMGTAMLLEAGLSFLGLGVRPPTASWGGDLRTAQSFLFDAPWLAVVPGMAIFIGVLAFNVAGDGLRDALDPRGQGAARGGN